MRSPSDKTSTSSVLPYISDADLLYHAHLLVDSWTSEFDGADLFLTADSHASIVSQKLGHHVVALPAGTAKVVKQYIHGATIGVDQRLMHDGRPLLYDQEFAVALTSLASIPSQRDVLRESKKLYAGLPAALVEAWYTRVSELCIYWTLGIVPEGAKEHILDSHLGVKGTKRAPRPRDEKKRVTSLALAGTSDSGTQDAPTLPSLSPSLPSADSIAPTDKTSTIATTNKTSSISPPSFPLSATPDTAASEDGHDEPAHANLEHNEEVELPIDGLAQAALPETPAPLALGVLPPSTDILAKEPRTISSLPLVISDDTTPQLLATETVVPLLSASDTLSTASSDDTLEPSLIHVDTATLDAASDQEDC